MERLDGCLALVWGMWFVLGKYLLVLYIWVGDRSDGGYYGGESKYELNT